MADENEVGIKVTSDTQEGTAGLSEVGDKMRQLPQIAQEALESFGELRQTFIEAFAVKEIGEFIERISALGEQAVRTSQMLGMSVEEVERLSAANKLAGGSSEGMITALGRLEVNLAQVGDSTNIATRAYAALGITQEQLKNSSPAQQILMIADAFQKSADGAAKDAIAKDIGGRSMQQMIPFLNLGSEGIKEFADKAKMAGVQLTDLQAEGLEKTAQGLTLLKMNIEGAGISIMELFKPAIDAIIDGLTSLIQVFRACVEMIRVMVTLFEGGLLIALALTIEKFEEMGVSAITTFNNIKIKVAEVANVIDDLVHGHLQAAVDAQKAGDAQIAKSNAAAAAQITTLSKDYDDLKTRILNATIATLTFGNAQEKAAKTNLNAPDPSKGKVDNSEQQMDKDDLQTELELNKISLQDKRDTDAEKVASGKMSKLQELEDLRGFAAQEFQLSAEAIQQQADLDSTDEVHYNALMNKKAVLAAQYNQTIAKLNAQSVEEQKKQYDALFSGINSAMKQSLNGILQGTQTWRQAMSHIFSDLLASFVENVVLKTVDQWTEGLALKLRLTAAWNAAMTALGIQGATDAATATAAANAAQNAAKITADAALAYAGVFANQAPLLGPAAAAPAAAASASIMALMPEATMAVGGWELESDMVAQLHQGEMVVPKTFADGLRDGGSFGGGGGDQYHITIQAIDTQTGAQFLKNNAAVIAQTLSKQSRNFNKNVPTWKS